MATEKRASKRLLALLGLLLTLPVTHAQVPGPAARPAAPAAAARKAPAPAPRLSAGQKVTADARGTASRLNREARSNTQAIREVAAQLKQAQSQAALERARGPSATRAYLRANAVVINLQDRLSTLRTSRTRIANARNDTRRALQAVRAERWRAASAHLAAAGAARSGITVARVQQVTYRTRTPVAGSAPGPLLVANPNVRRGVVRRR